MLETEDVDDDYFTPVANASLAKIFSKSIKEIDSETEGSSLKYVRQSQSYSTSGCNKTTECVLACAVTAYERCGNEYILKGKIGFAIIKTIKSDQHNVVLYDSKKITLSHTLISSELLVSVKDKCYLSFYDNQNKYWSLYILESDLTKIIEVFKKLNVVVKISSNKNERDRLPNVVNVIKSEASDKDSDTDSSFSVPKKTKDSILCRMASMGQAIIPLKSIEKTSDSSDDNDSDIKNSYKHKQIRPIIRKNNAERHVPQMQSTLYHNQTATENTEHPSDNISLYVSGQLLPTTSNIITTSNSSILTEQRINNSKLRINLNRLSDKVDLILDKIKHCKASTENKNNDVQAEVTLKLLREYENKIKYYEKIIKDKGIISMSMKSEEELSSQHCKETDLKQVITNFEDYNIIKDIEITKLNDEINLLKAKLLKLTENEVQLKLENEQLKESRSELSQHYDAKHINTDLEIKIKKIMNDAFHVITESFVDNERYSGEAIKKVIAKTIKEVTVNSLQKQNKINM